jgi:hypothetical protein
MKTMNILAAMMLMTITAAMPATARADRMKGVIDTKWNPRTRELTIIYDAKVTSARHIRHFMA